MLFRFRCLQPASRPGFCTALHGCLPPVPGRAAGGGRGAFFVILCTLWRQGFGKMRRGLRRADAFREATARI